MRSDRLRLNRMSLDRIGLSRARLDDVRWRVAALVVAGALLFTVSYIGIAASAGDRSPTGAQVAGIEVGGLDRAGIREWLDSQLAPRAKQKLTVVAGSGSTTLIPASAGLGVDTDATAARVCGFSLQPDRVWHRLVGAAPTTPVTTVNRERLRAAVNALATTLDQNLVQGGISFSAQGAQLTQPAEGRKVDREQAADILAKRWYEGAPVPLPVTIHQPAVEPELMRRAYEEFAMPATSAPLRLRIGARVITLPVAQFAPTLSVSTSEFGDVVPQVDGAALAAVVADRHPELGRAPQDASVRMAGSELAFTSSKVGRGLDPKELAAAVLPALTSSQRTATVSLSTTAPRLSTAALKALNITDRVSTFSTALTDDPDRTKNIDIAARALDSTVVPVGATFSLNQALGERTPAKGYRKAQVIEGGRLANDFGGGVSQVSTTLFNAVFLAGLQTLEHEPHAFYIERYPEGRDATLSWPGVDQKFRNDSGHPLLIKTSAANGELIVSFYGTKIWQVRADKSRRTHLRPPQTLHDNSPECVEQEPMSGFDVTVTRISRREGQPERSEKFVTHYQPEDRVICD